jgi:hypothetical protein
MLLVKSSKCDLTLLSISLIIILALSQAAEQAIDDDSKEPPPSRQTNSGNTKAEEPNDYFYDEALKPEEIAEIQKTKKEEEEKKRKEATTTTEPPPGWFEKKEDNPMMEYMKQACQEYVKKHFEEMTKSKTKSTLNHSMLSLITLTGFFSAGIFIGLMIVLIKGRTFRKAAAASTTSTNGEKSSFKSKLEGKFKSKKSKGEDKAAYLSVQQTEQIV